MMHEHHRPAAFTDALCEILLEKGQAAERSVTSLAFHLRRIADDDAEGHEMHARPIPRVVQSVRRNIGETRAALVTGDDLLHHSRVALRAVVIAVNLPHRPAQLAFASI